MKRLSTLLPLVLILPLGCAPDRDSLTVYCAQDQTYAEQLFRHFETGSGVKILPVYDSEAVKTVGLANRLLAERAQPRCDVFWGNEEMRTRQLASRGIFGDTPDWAAFGYRSRRIVINTNHLTVASAPRSLLELTNQAWQGKVALAYPQFGTTAAHFHSLRQHWGDALWQAWCRGLASNRALVVDGNSVVVRRVGGGDAWLGLTDSDDIEAGQREGLPVAAVPLTPEMLLIPNTVGVVKGAPHPALARRFVEYLQKPEVVGKLVEAKALEGVSPAESPNSGLKVDWEALLRDMESVTAKLNEIFLR
jgi:iron(III) transport system substrate-binding protein